jgi:hypothetical protein
MKHQHLLSIALATILFVGLYWAVSISASTCSGTFSEKWACGSTVYYSFSGFDATQTDKIQTAIGEWNALANTNKVVLSPATTVNPAKLEFISGTTGDNCTAGRAETRIDLATSAVISAKIYFHFSNTCAPDGGGTTFNVWNPSSPTTYQSFLIKTALHEIGHTMGLTHSSPTTSAEQTDLCQYEDGKTIMNPFCNPNDSGNNLPTTISDCDKTNLITLCPTPTPEPTPYPTPSDGCYYPIENFSQGACPLYFSEDSTGYYCCSVGCSYESEEQVWDPSGYGELDCGVCQDGIDNDCGDGGADDQDYDCGDCWPSPILIDTLGDGFDMSGAANGVDFDIRGVGRPIRVSWPLGDDAWLALDRNANGAIDNGKELFGNFTYQLSSPERNGFRALHVYDETANGGNADGVINAQDAIFQSLRLWLDSDRNGISEPSELFGLASKNVAEIELDYKLSQRTDGKGNRFRYRAKIKSADGSQLGRWAWDVFLSLESSSDGSANALLIQPFQYYQPIRPTRPACGLKTRA